MMASRPDGRAHQQVTAVTAVQSPDCLALLPVSDVLCARVVVMRTQVWCTVHGWGEHVMHTYGMCTQVVRARTRVYMYVCECACVCVCTRVIVPGGGREKGRGSRAQSHTHITSLWMSRLLPLRGPTDPARGMGHFCPLSQGFVFMEMPAPPLLGAGNFIFRKCP